MLRDFIIVLEADYGNRNFSAYIPELRLSTVGDTEDEVLACAKDLIAIEMENSNVETFSSKIVTLQVEATPTTNEGKNFQAAV
ncbi:hypothetical protein WJ0W_006747 [Paenibacillus melissococcoides]|uniref:HicB-like antitoxin of toxin-antitoxin system domain-containing protein n=1 Tax=Paenibacillus melissococcoides TaxID=2912268 RepID=A0ABM9GE52_9BACL|nr:MULTISPECIES: hypothetical protein [Paenibacillus]MEB9897602.1 hypothetical protein [Bacillus cereus]GIO82305.1 hypothetical protein J6TS7_59150 [Paenibacillus dendritiformis]CAH8249562.1 hypothetical protein WJ0W_006747 [Paenibacillus melissococcoides]CAH8721069.1 hypothetical protein HTL2_006172 [Paenibacillus melissococcoides]